MKRYKASLTRNGRYGCEIVIEGRDADHALTDTIRRYTAEEGCRFSVSEETE